MVFGKKIKIVDEAPAAPKGFLVSLTVIGSFIGMPMMEAGANDKPLDICGFYGL